MNDELSYYGGYRTKTFAETFNSAASFKEAYETCGIPVKFSNPGTIETLFYLLYGNYGTSHFASYRDENQTIYQLFSIVFMYGPTWEKRLEIQDRVRALTLDEVRKGGRQIYNKALNPDEAPSTNSMEALPYINEQNTANQEKSIVEGYSNILALLDTDVTKEFIDRFKPLFIKSVAPTYPLLYSTPKDSPVNAVEDQEVLTI